MVTFDPEFAKRIKDWNKLKEKNNIDRETPEELNALAEFIIERKFSVFHGEHRRAAISYLHEVYIYFLIYQYLLNH